VSELEKSGYLTKTRMSRRNQYEVHEELQLRQLRHPRHRHHSVGELLRFLEEPKEGRGSTGSS